MTKPRLEHSRYAGHRIYKLRTFEGGYPHRMVECYNPKVGRKREVACFYEVKIGEEWLGIRRYDSDHGIFHRHHPVWVKKGQIDHKFSRTPMLQRASIALKDIGEHAKEWQASIPKEVLEHERSA